MLGLQVMGPNSQLSGLQTNVHELVSLIIYSFHTTVLQLDTKYEERLWGVGYLWFGDINDTKSSSAPRPKRIDP